MSHGKGTITEKILSLVAITFTSAIACTQNKTSDDDINRQALHMQEKMLLQVPFSQAV